MMGSGVGIRAGVPADAAGGEAVYAAAFTEDPVKSWALPRGSAGLVGALVVRPLEEGEVAVAERGGAIVGVATWLDLETSERIAGQAEELAALACAQPGLGRLAATMGLLAEHHPDRDHDYLATMGVAPGARGRGVGGALLEHRLAAAEGRRRPAYLEASTGASARLYARYGFAALGPALELAEGGPLCRPMWREPAAGTGAQR